MRQRSEPSQTAKTPAELEEADTPLTDALLDQFASYYLFAVLAVKALEEARRHARTAGRA
ncbi:MAG: hypothetical protein VX017_04475 [Pseudomonadota bacterium]|nr:hypothetical protein [Pseudomonadota bacterium]MEC8262547.1 hypothetical protein [Pseudomonadota bacterium]